MDGYRYNNTFNTIKFRYMNTKDQVIIIKHMNIKQNKINNKILIIEKILLVALLVSVVFFMVLWILMIEKL
jgi:hypothetical protein